MPEVRRHGEPPYRTAVIHGGPGAPGSAAPLARALAGGVTAGGRGAGRGVLEPIQGADSVEGQVEELAGALRAEAAGPAAVIGHSWGAMLGLLLAARRPEAVAKLILVGSGPLEARWAESILPTRLARLTPAEREEIEAILAAASAGEDEVEPGTWARLGALFARTDGFDPLGPEDAAGSPAPDPPQPWMYRKVWAEAETLRREGGFTAAARAVRCPVVAVHGAYDPHPAEGVREPLARALGDRFRFVLLERCGHTPWEERQARARFFAVLEAELAG